MSIVTKILGHRRPILSQRESETAVKVIVGSHAVGDSLRDLHAVRDRAELCAIFTHLCENVAEDLQRKGDGGKTSGIKLRYDDFRIATRDQTIDRFTADGKTIRQTAGQCLKRVPLERRIRLLGVRAGHLVRSE